MYIQFEYMFVWIEQICICIAYTFVRTLVGYFIILGVYRNACFSSRINKFDRSLIF